MQLLRKQFFTFLIYKFTKIFFIMQTYFGYSKLWMLLFINMNFLNHFVNIWNESLIHFDSVKKVMIKLALHKTINSLISRCNYHVARWMTDSSSRKLAKFQLIYPTQEWSTKKAISTFLVSYQEGRGYYYSWTISLF